MEYSCYCCQDDEAMTVFAFAFAKKDDLILVNFFYFTCIDGNLEEDILSFIIKKSDLEINTNLYIFYNLSIILTENISNLVYRKKSLFLAMPQDSWGILCRKHCIVKGFSDEYDYNFGFIEHPSDKFNSFENKKETANNKYSIKYYKSVYERSFNASNYINLYITQEIKKIEKELVNIDYEVQKDIMMCNANIMKEVLPEDIVDKIKLIICL